MFFLHMCQGQNTLHGRWSSHLQLRNPYNGYINPYYSLTQGTRGREFFHPSTCDFQGPRHPMKKWQSTESTPKRLQIFERKRCWMKIPWKTNLCRIPYPYHSFMAYLPTWKVDFYGKCRHIYIYIIHGWYGLCSNPFCSRGFGVG